MNIIEQNRTLLLYPLSEDIGRFPDSLSYDKKIGITPAIRGEPYATRYTMTRAEGDDALG